MVDAIIMDVVFGDDGLALVFDGLEHVFFLCGKEVPRQTSFVSSEGISYCRIVEAWVNLVKDPSLPVAFGVCIPEHRPL